MSGGDASLAPTPPPPPDDVPLRPFWRCAALTAACSPATAAFLAQHLTVVVNTSPCSAHPSTRMLEETCASLALAPGLAACRLLLVFDGFKLRDRLRVKRGAVTPDVAAAYERYAARVELLTRTPGSALEGAHVLRLAEHHGCAHALRRGLTRTRTPYVLVVQHGASLLRCGRRIRGSPHSACCCSRACDPAPQTERCARTSTSRRTALRGVNL